MLKLRVSSPSANRGKNAARHLRYIATREGAVRNAAYIAYIAKRTGAVTNENQDFGLFGKYKKVNGPVLSLKDAMKYVKEKSETGTHIYKVILSVKEKDALKLGLNNREGWNKTIRQHMHIIAKEMDIPIERFEWLASVHMEKGHPHVHLDFWDKEQGVRNYFVPPEKANHLRESLTRAFFSEEMKPLFESRKQAKDLLKDEALGILGRVEAGIQNTVNREKGTLPDEVLHLRSVQKHFPRFQSQMNDILEALPQTGSLKQQYMPEDVKEKLRILSEDIVKSSPQCKAAMERYLEASRDIAEMYSGKSERWEEAKATAETYVYKEIENKILQALRPLLRERAKALNKATAKQEDDYFVPVADYDTAFSVNEAALTQINRMCARVEAQRPIRRTDEMSKQAKKEYMLKKQSISGIDWSAEAYTSITHTVGPLALCLCSNVVAVNITHSR